MIIVGVEALRRSLGTVVLGDEDVEVTKNGVPVAVLRPIRRIVPEEPPEPRAPLSAPGRMGAGAE